MPSSVPSCVLHPFFNTHKHKPKHKKHFRRQCIAQVICVLRTPSWGRTSTRPAPPCGQQPEAKKPLPSRIFLNRECKSVASLFDSGLQKKNLQRCNSFSFRDCLTAGISLCRLRENNLARLQACCPAQFFTYGRDITDLRLAGR